MKEKMYDRNETKYQKAKKENDVNERKTQKHWKKGQYESK